jgi:hypothetical protein
MRKIVAQYADMTATPYLADRDVINADAISPWCFASFSTGYIK